MGRYIWYAEGASNRAFRAKVIKYVTAGGQIAEVRKSKRTNPGVVHQPDPEKKVRVEQSAIKLATRHFENMNYAVRSVEGDKVGWDLNAVHSHTGLLLRVEVKGFSGRKSTLS